MSIDLRVPRHDELRPWLEAVERAFGEGVRDERMPHFERIIERDRILAAYDGDAIVGGGAIFSFRLTIPGGEVPAAAVTAVGVLPTHRRRGILTSLMERQLRDAAERGEPVAILWASEGSIYGRFGYGLATLWANIEVPRDRASFRRDVPAEGSVRFVTQDEAERLFPPVYDAVRTVTPGFYDRTEAWWQTEVLDDPEHRRHGAGPRFLVAFEVDGRCEGYVIYRVRSDWEWTGPKSVLEVRELMAATPRALRELWRFCFSVDLIRTVRANLLSPDHPLLHMVNEPRRLDMRIGDALWVRIVDLPAALMARSFAAEDRIVLEVADDLLPSNAGRWLLDARAGAAIVERTAAPADLALDTTDLAAVYLGGSTFDALARSGRGTELTDGARRRADRLFRTDRLPWAPQIF
jgi:predicted acetyltransferase